jgi:hypothetical protein
MRRLPILTALTVLSFAAMLRADSAPGDLPSTAIRPVREEDILKEMLTAYQVRQFEQTVERLAERLERSAKETDRETGKLLRTIVADSRQRPLDVRLEHMIAAFKAKEARIFVEQGEKLARDLRRFTHALDTEELAKTKALRQQLIEPIRQASVVIRAQKIVRAKTERNMLSSDDLVEAQHEATQATAAFAALLAALPGRGRHRFANDKPLADALEQQRLAAQSLANGKNDEAIDRQDAAILKLDATRRALETFGQQLHDEVAEAQILQLDARCRLMLCLQRELNDAAADLAQGIQDRVDKKPTAADRERARGLAQRQALISRQATRTLKLLDDDGTAVAFCEVFRELHDDMDTAGRQLHRGDVGPDMLARLRDVADTLAEMVDALRKANADGPRRDDRLFDPLAELKLVRSRQMRTHQRRERLEQQTDGPTDRAEIKELGQRQQSLLRLVQNRFTRSD